jgi:hypothetical protein
MGFLKVVSVSERECAAGQNEQRGPRVQEKSIFHR